MRLEWGDQPFNQNETNRFTNSRWCLYNIECVRFCKQSPKSELLPSRTLQNKKLSVFIFTLHANVVSTRYTYFLTQSMGTGLTGKIKVGHKHECWFKLFIFTLSWLQNPSDYVCQINGILLYKKIKNKNICALERFIRGQGIIFQHYLCVCVCYSSFWREHGAEVMGDRRTILFINVHFMHTALMNFQS